MCPDVRPEWPGITYLKINKYINIAISNSYLSRASTAGGAWLMVNCSYV